MLYLIGMFATEALFFQLEWLPYAMYLFILVSLSILGPPFHFLDSYLTPSQHLEEFLGPN